MLRLPRPPCLRGVLSLGKEWCGRKVNDVTIVIRGSIPGQVSEGRVHRTGDHFGVDGSELIDAVTERHYLSRADERTVGEYRTALNRL